MTKSPVDQQLTMGVAEIASMCGRTVRWVQIVAKEQAVEKDGRGKYRLASFVAAIVSHYEALQESNSKVASASRATDARAREIELRIARQERTLIPREDADLAIDLVVGEVNKQLAGLPARVTRDVPLRRKIEAEVDETKRKIAEALGNGKELNRTGRDPTDPDDAD